MKNVGGIWLPDEEEHLVKWMKTANVVVDGNLTYQYNKLQIAMKHVKQWRTAIDIGAHVGLWSIHLVKRFEKVVAFEPVTAYRDCLYRNVDVTNISVMQVALGRQRGSANLAFETASTGGTHLVDAIEGDVPVLPLDDYHVRDVDFVKIDVEGYELYVVQGGEKTIRENRPAMVVEQKPKGLAERYGVSRMAAVDLLKSWGAEVKAEISGDYVLSWS